ncbi:WG repeat-containing protein [Burkholderia sp. NLJ2]|uniref:WG repeat-containing protein n=1 Tax=Burkholderia sp. NLJ2 TaxID=3090699 RepID=UPI003C6C9622
MAHRMYMFNLQDIGPAGTPCLNMVEWNYDFPTVLSPLLAVAPFLARNRCNDTGNDDGIYAEAEGGKTRMARLYAFLERHADRLIDDLDAFREAKRKIFAFLENRAIHRYFHLNGWDVFNLSAEPHVELAQALLARIERDNARIEHAIEADDPTILDQCEGLAEEDVSSFRELINQDHYDYGWEPLTSIYYEQVEVFEQDGKMGVMAITGETLVPPRYDEICFDAWMEVAIVRQGDRYGHIDSQGKAITPVQYERVWAFWRGEYARVLHDGKFGVVDRNGVQVIPCRYTALTVLLHSGSRCWAACEHERWGVLDASGQWRLPADYESIDDSIGRIVATPPGKDVPDIFTRRFVRLGTLPDDDIVAFEVEHDEDSKVFRYEVKQAGTETVAMFDEDGQPVGT